MPNPAKNIESLLETALEEHCFSGFQLHCENKGSVFSLEGGIVSYWDKKPVRVRPSTFFDIGSITKTVATTSLLALGVDKGEITLDQPLSRFLPELKDGLGKRTLMSLLSHASGLKWWIPLYRLTRPGEHLKWIASHEKDCIERKPGEKAVYSDLNFILLGEVIHKVWGDLETAFLHKVAIPTGMTETQFSPLPEGTSVAATEYCLWREQLLQGEVFDENCAFLGGKCGHAGLFSTARGLAPWCREWLKARKGMSQWLGRETALLFTSRVKEVPKSTWGLGWDTRSDVGSTAGQRFSPDSFGTLGFPGCSIWFDPFADGFAILLANRIHPSRFDDRIRTLRPRVHDHIAGLWEATAV